MVNTSLVANAKLSLKELKIKKPRLIKQAEQIKELQKELATERETSS